MDQQKNLANQARSLAESERERILCEIPEVDLHDDLKSLFEHMEPSFHIEVTHGVQEYGKDLVIVNTSKFSAQIVGVVVKRGDIKGGTIAGVDDLLAATESASKTGTPRELAEIESQIQQASAILAELKSVYAQLRVTDVFVVIVGKISLSVRKRLQAQLPGHITVFDLHWLTKNFTEFYPEVFFDGRAQNYIQTEIERLQQFPWMSQKDRNLTDYYVEPTFMSCDVPLDLNVDHLSQLAELRRLPFQKLPDIIARKGHVLVLGDPGSGKSAALAKMALDKLRAASMQLRMDRHNAHDLGIPVLLTARELLSVERPEDLLAFRLKDPNMVPDGLRVDCLLVDALDEIPRSERAKALQKATDYGDSQKCSVVVASRRAGDIQSLSNGNYAKYEVLPFETPQAVQLFKRLVSSETLLTNLTEGLQRIELQIPLFPLSLLLLIKLVEQNQEVPASVTQLYTDFLDIALGKYDQDKGIQVLFEYRVKKAFLARLAFEEFHKKDRLVIPHEDFDCFLDRYAEEQDINKEKLQDFLLEIERAGILDLREDVEFKHRTFLDYFAACYIFDHREAMEHLHEKIVQIYYEGYWEEVTFFYVGLKTELDGDLLTMLLKHDHSAFPDMVSRLMIGRLLQAGWQSTALVKRQGIDGAIEVTESIHALFLELCRKHNASFPAIFADFLTLSFVSISLSSMFLKTQLTELRTQYMAQAGEKTFLRSILLLWAEQRLMAPEEFRAAVLQCSGQLDHDRSLSPVQKARYLSLLSLASSKDPALRQLISRKLNKLTNRYPNVMKGLLPFRQPPRRLTG